MAIKRIDLQTGEVFSVPADAEINEADVPEKNAELEAEGAHFRYVIVSEDEGTNSEK